MHGRNSLPHPDERTQKQTCKCDSHVKQPKTKYVTASVKRSKTPFKHTSTVGAAGLHSKNDPENDSCKCKEKFTPEFSPVNVQYKHSEI